METPLYAQRPYGRMAYDFFPGDRGALVFIHGYQSDRGGSKAAYLKQLCADHGLSYCAMDCMAHGESDGEMVNFTLSQALDDVLYALTDIMDQPAILVGSSMGGWLSLRAAEMMPERVKALIGIAAAPDFTTEIAARLTPEQMAAMASQGYIEEESGYDQPYVFSRTLIEDGQEHLMLHREIDYSGPVTLLQGKQDPAVDWRKAGHIAECLTQTQAKCVMIEDGDHSLSRDQDLALLGQAVLDYSAA